MRALYALIVSAVLVVLSPSVHAVLFVEDFADPLGGWTSDWLYLNTNMENYYVADGTCDADSRGNNATGLWISDDRGCNTYSGVSPVRIDFYNDFGDAATFFSIDVCAFEVSTLDIYDKDGVLDDSVAIPADCSFLFNYTTHSFPLTNGISRFEFVGDGLEGNTSIDNVTIDTTPVEGSTSRATFRVTKDFTDDNPTPVDVHLSCTTGLILDQSASVVDPDGAYVGAEVQVGEGAASVVVAQNGFTEIVFVVTHFDSGELNCELTETVPAGYDVSYFNGSVSNDISCDYENVVSDSSFDCEITNTPAPVEVTITKEWIFEGTSDGNGIDLDYRLTLWCDAEIVGGYNPYDQSLEAPQGIGPGCGLSFLKQEGAQGSPIHEWCKAFSGEGPDVFDAEVIPEYPDSNCFVVETVYDSAVEIDNGCGSLTVGAGQGASCTITNTVFFEGIPTLDRFGLAIMLFLTMGVGVIAFRRIV